MVVLPSFSFAANCPEYESFFREVNPAKKSWNDLYKIYKQADSGCDDGVYAEVYSDFVVQSLAKYWDRFDELVTLINKDSLFRDFVLKHIDATTDMGDLEALSRNALQHCPSSAESFCREMDKEARAAIEEIRVYVKKK